MPHHENDHHENDHHENDQERFVSIVRANPFVDEILDRAPQLGFTDWYLTAGALFQTVWNHASKRESGAGIRDYDLFYFEADDLTYEAEDRVIGRARELFADLPVDVEVRNEARVHLWYEEHFGVPAIQFSSCRDAIDHFASTTCCYGIRTTDAGTDEVYAPHGFGDVFGMIVRPNPVLATREVYETKARRWKAEWPALEIVSWPN